MNFVRRLKHVVLPAPLGPISAWIVPRVTFRLTPLTATKPANSLVRFSVWRVKLSLTTPRPCWSAAVLPRPQRVEQNRGGGFCAHSHLRHAARRKAAWACRLDGMSGARARPLPPAAARSPPLPPFLNLPPLLM